MLFDYWVGGRSGHTHTRQADFQRNETETCTKKGNEGQEKTVFYGEKGLSVCYTQTHSG